MMMLLPLFGKIGSSRSRLCNLSTLAGLDRDNTTTTATTTTITTSTTTTTTTITTNTNQLLILQNGGTKTS